MIKMFEISKMLERDFKNALERLNGCIEEYEKTKEISIENMELSSACLWMCHYIINTKKNLKMPNEHLKDQFFNQRILDYEKLIPVYAA
jgi:hypothetical protein